MDFKENDTNFKDIEEENNLLKISLNLNEEKYLLKLYPSKDNITIVFKLEKEKIQTYYYFEKFDLRDFRQTNKTFISDGTIHEVFLHLKDISKKSIITLEKKETKIKLTFKIKNEEKYIFKFILRKKIVSQDRLNPLLVEQIQDNKSKIINLNKQIKKYDNTIQIKNDVINEIKGKIANINNILNNININSINNTNSTKNSSSNEDNSENTSINSNNNDEEDSNNLKNKNLFEDSDSSKGGRKNKKKNKNIYNQFNYNSYENKNNNKMKNNDNTAFCFENMEIFQNKKVIELLIILNVVTILIVLYILGSIYNLKTNYDYDKIKDEDFMNKLAYLSFSDDSNDEDYINYRDIFRENMDYQLKKKEEERITRSVLKDDYLDDRKRKIQERRKRNNKL